MNKIIFLILFTAIPFMAGIYIHYREMRRNKNGKITLRNIIETRGSFLLLLSMISFSVLYSEFIAEKLPPVFSANWFFWVCEIPALLFLFVILPGLIARVMHALIRYWYA